MRSSFSVAVALLLSLVALEQLAFSTAKKPSSSRGKTTAATVTGRRSPSGGSGRPPPARDPPVSRRRTVIVEEEDVYDEDEEGDGGEYSAVLDDDEEEVMDDEDGDDDDDELPPPKRRTPPSSSSSTSSSSRRPPPSSRTARNAAVHGNAAAAGSSRKRPPPSSSRSRYEDDDERPIPRSSGSGSRRTPPDRRGPPPGAGRGRGSGGGGRPGGSVVPYARGPPKPTAFSSVIAGIRSAVPDTESVKNAALSSIKAARETTSSISSNLYREVKGLTSSELEQVMLKATRPDDTAVKGKHVERLVGVTYQISARYDIYDAVLRKLWSKMAEKDWRTTIKALYILHRFSADGAPDHAPALKARLRELRRTRDPKRKDKYFNTKQLLAGETSPENVKFRAFMARYAHYVLLRTQCFGGMFDEILSLPKADKKKPPKPITSTSLRAEHLEAAAILLKAGVACQLKDGEECENTAIAAERVASDLIGLTTAVAVALNRALKDDDLKGADPVLLKKWCEFYGTDLQPQTRAMVKKTSTKLDAFGLFLPSRMGTSVSRELLERGLSLEASEGGTTESDQPEPPAEEGSASVAPATDDAEPTSEEKEGAETAKDATKVTKPASLAETAAERTTVNEDAVEEEAEVDEEYEYEEEDYYDEEE